MNETRLLDDILLLKRSQTYGAGTSPDAESFFEVAVYIIQLVTLPPWSLARTLNDIFGIAPSGRFAASACAA